MRTAATLLAVLLVFALPAIAQNQGGMDSPMNPGMGMGGGMGQGMGQGMGPGMGQGMGRGTGQGMGPGMGQGMGMGRMGDMMGMCPMCGMMGMGGMLPGQIHLMHAAALGLSDEQIQKVQGIQTDFRRQQIRTGSEIQLNQIDLQQEMMKDKPDAAKVERLIRNTNQLQGDLQIAMMKSSMAAKEVLTPEQRKKAMSMMMKPPMPAGGQQPMMGPGGGMQPMSPGMPMQH